MPGWPELDRLRSAVCRPSATVLSSTADPASVIMAYADLAPIVLWGSWLGDELIIAVDPLIIRSGLDAAECWEPLAALPQRPSGDVGIGGAWFTVLGYDPGTSGLAFCDSLLRRCGNGTWVFETLGLRGREQSVAAALNRARTAVASARTQPPSLAAAGIGPLGPVGDPTQVADDHLAGVERVIGRIRAGEVYQLNLCTRLTAELREAPLELFVRTVGALRPTYGAYLPTGPEHTLISLSPERFLTLQDGTVSTSPIKGTTKRSEDPDGSLLRSSVKDAAENVMITDLMRNDLSRVCLPGSVAVPGLLEVRPYPGVWHLVSTVTGRLDPRHSAADLLAASFPPGSVTGAPKSSAVRAIAVEEPHARSCYTGAAGLITAGGHAELGVLIRTFELHGSRVELGVGGGITVDSVPVREWRECLHKAEPLALGADSRLADGLVDEPPAVAEVAGQGIFESILLQHGRPLRVADHLARLARSVRELYTADLPDDLAARVRAATVSARHHARVALRVLARPRVDGLDLEITTRPLGARLGTCSLVQASRDLGCWRHKWVRRDALDRAEQQTAPALPYFCDPAGRVAETSRGNVFLRGADGRWRTPPSGEHQLPGVTRRALLDKLTDRGVPVDIAPITLAELHSADAVLWTSSLSGVVAVRAIDGRPLKPDDAAVTWSRWLGVR